MPIIHGVTGQESTTGTVPITAAATSIIGLIAYAPDADPIAYPLNTPVLVTSITRALTGAGYTGTLRRALDAINPITNPTMVIVRCESGAVSDVIGTTGDAGRTGIQAFQTAKSKLGVTPKILIASELESPDVDQAMTALAKKLRGYYYAIPRTVDPADANKRIMIPTKTAVQAYRDTLGDREIELIWPEFTSGNVLTGYTDGSTGAFRIVSTQAITADDGGYHFPRFYLAATGTVGVTNGRAANWLGDAISGNPYNATPQEGYEGVITALNADLQPHGLLARLIANNFIEIVSSTEFFYDANDYDGGPLGAFFTPLGTVPHSDTAIPPVPVIGAPIYGAGTLPTSAVAAGLRAQLDNTVGFPKSLSNVVVNGPTGINVDVTWDMEDQNTDAAYLNDHQITTLIQHEGFRFWGNRNCSTDPHFVFEVYTRTAYFMLDTIIAGVFPFVDQTLTPFMAKDIIDSINAELRILTKANPQKILGGFCWYDPDQNSAEQLKAGQFWVSYDYTPIPPLEQLGVIQKQTSKYLVDFGKLLSGAAA